MSDTLAKRIEKARATMNQLPDWISFNARFEGGENIRPSDTSDHTIHDQKVLQERSLSNNSEIAAV